MRKENESVVIVEELLLTFLLTLPFLCNYFISKIRMNWRSLENHISKEIKFLILNFWNEFDIMCLDWGKEKKEYKCGRNKEKLDYNLRPKNLKKWTSLRSVFFSIYKFFFDSKSSSNRLNFAFDWPVSKHGPRRLTSLRV